MNNQSGINRDRSTAAETRPGGGNGKKFRDLLLSVGATAVFNMVIQLFLYPQMNRTLGNEVNGMMLASLSVLSVAAGSVGTAANYSRMVCERTHPVKNGDYNLFLLFGFLLSTAAGIPFLIRFGFGDPVSILSYVLLTLMTMLRYYSDVEFKRQKNFLRYFVYYLLISVGYVAGVFLFRLTGVWQAAFLCGETLAIVYAAVRTTLFRVDTFRAGKALKAIFLSALLLLCSSLLENLTLNADRLVLATFVNGEATTAYYQASLLGKVVAMLTVPINSLVISYLATSKMKFTAKFWCVCVGAATLLGGLAFAACRLVSPPMLWLLYEDWELARGYLTPAILSQVFYFVAGVLLIVCLPFFGEKRQLWLNVTYAAVFFAATVAGTVLWGLPGFVYGALAGNGFRFLLALASGFVSLALSRRQKADSLQEETV